MKKNHPRLLKWFAACSLAGLLVSCATSEPIDEFDQNAGSGTGGVTATGGSSTGGSPGTGGSSTGGSPGTGGAATGGSPGTGGSVSGTGGQPATGGSGGHASGSGGQAGAGTTGNGGRGGAAGGAAGGRTGSGGSGGAGGASNATFAFVQTTITANCAGSTCHSGTQTPVFATTSNLYSNLTTMKAADCMNYPLVTPGMPSQSALYLAITSMCGTKVPRMPDGKAALPTATISSIQTWIMNGAPQQ